MPEITTAQALDLLTNLSNAALKAQDEADRLLRERDSVIASLDGQEGMARSAMAEACGVTRGRIHQILTAVRGRGVETENVLMSDALRRALDEATSLGDWAGDSIHLDVVHDLV